MATVSETGWPYVQHRGGPRGFLKCVDDRTLAFADYRGNRQYISTGNLAADDRACLFLMDYADRARLKIYAHVEDLALDADPALTELVTVPDYKAKLERIFRLRLENFDWNCPQHITPRFTEQEVSEAVRRFAIDWPSSKPKIPSYAPPAPTTENHNEHATSPPAPFHHGNRGRKGSPSRRWLEQPRPGKGRASLYRRQLLAKPRRVRAGREAIVGFLARKWQRELDYRLIKELWGFRENRMAVRFAYEWHDDSGNWFRSYGNENWEFDENGLMRRRFASINDAPIREADRRFHWSLGRRPDDHPGLSDLGF